MISFTLSGAPRTKKTHSRVIRVAGFVKVIPSKAHEIWFGLAMAHAPEIRAILVSAGITLPVTGPINVRAIFYRKQASGDLLGYEQALADWMQTPRISKKCKLTRNGAGIIVDDSQIVSWDGSRLAKDSAMPRIEVEITVAGVERAS